MHHSAADKLSRRQMLSASAAAVAAVGMAASGFSLAENMSGAMDHSKMHKHDSMSAIDAKRQAIIDTAMDCVKSGRECAQHCIEMLESGDQTMKDCYASVRELVVSCDALAQLAIQNSKHFREFVQVCTKVCEDCEKVCQKYAKQTRQCKDCAESCKACVKACKDFLAA